MSINVNTDYHKVITQAALNPDTCGVLHKFTEQLREFVHNPSETSIVVSSEKSFERLLWHQLAAYFLMSSKKRAPDSFDIVITKPDGFNPDDLTLAERLKWVQSASTTLMKPDGTQAVIPPPPMRGQGVQTPMPSVFPNMDLQVFNDPSYMALRNHLIMQSELRNAHSDPAAFYNPMSMQALSGSTQQMGGGYGVGGPFSAPIQPPPRAIPPQYFMQGPGRGGSHGTLTDTLLQMQQTQQADPSLMQAYMLAQAQAQAQAQAPPPPRQGDIFAMQMERLRMGLQLPTAPPQQPATGGGAGMFSPDLGMMAGLYTANTGPLVTAGGLAGLGQAPAAGMGGMPGGAPGLSDVAAALAQQDPWRQNAGVGGFGADPSGGNFNFPQ